MFFCCSKIRSFNGEVPKLLTAPGLAVAAGKAIESIVNKKAGGGG